MILWSSEENRIQVIDPGESAIREIAPGSGELRRELIASQLRKPPDRGVTDMGGGNFTRVSGR